MLRFYRPLGAALAVLAAAGASASPAIPFKQESSTVASGLGASAGAVLLMSLVAIGLVLFLRKRFNLQSPLGRGARLVRVLDTERLGPRGLLSVVEFNGQHYLLAQGEHGISCVASGPAPVGAAAVADQEPA